MDAEDVPTRRQKSRLTVESGNSSALSEREKEASKKSKKKKKKRPSRRDELDPPFYILVLQVGTALFVLCTVSFYLYRKFVPYEPPEMEVEYYQDDYQYDNPQEEGVVEEAVVASPTAAPTKPTPPPLPVWELGNASKFDAFAMAEKYEEEAKEKRGDDNIQYKSFWAIARSLREQFADTYGGENAARAILERSMTTFQNGTDSAPPGDLVHTACRIKQAKDEDRPFKFTFGGYSVTVGRGVYL